MTSFLGYNIIQQQLIPVGLVRLGVPGRGLDHVDDTSSHAGLSEITVYSH